MYRELIELGIDDFSLISSLAALDTGDDVDEYGNFRPFCFRKHIREEITGIGLNLNQLTRKPEELLGLKVCEQFSTDPNVYFRYFSTIQEAYEKLNDLIPKLSTSDIKRVLSMVREIEEEIPIVFTIISAINLECPGFIENFNGLRYNILHHWEMRAEELPEELKGAPRLSNIKYDRFTGRRFSDSYKTVLEQLTEKEVKSADSSILQFRTGSAWDSNTEFRFDEFIAVNLETYLSKIETYSEDVVTMLEEFRVAVEKADVSPRIIERILRQTKIINKEVEVYDNGNTSLGEDVLNILLENIDTIKDMVFCKRISDFTPDVILSLYKIILV